MPAPERAESAHWRSCFRAGGRTRPAAVRQAEAVGLEQPTRRPQAGAFDCWSRWSRVADRAGSAVLGNGFDGHVAGFRGVPWGIPLGLEGPQGAAMRPTRTPSVPLPANRRVNAGPERVHTPGLPPWRRSCSRAGGRIRPAAVRQAEAVGLEQHRDDRRRGPSIAGPGGSRVADRAGSALDMMVGANLGYGFEALGGNDSIPLMWAWAFTYSPTEWRTCCRFAIPS